MKLKTKSTSVIGILAIASVLGIMLTVSNSNLAISATNTDPSVAPIPQLDFDDPSKAIVVRLIFNDDDTVNFDSALVSFERAHTHIGDPPVLEGVIIDVKDVLINQFNLWNPLWLFDDNPDGTHSVEVRQSVSGRIVFPFESDASTLRINDTPTNQELIEVNLKPIIHDFCIDNLPDPDCFESDLEIVSIGAINPPPLVLLGQSDDFTIQTIIDNNGPDKLIVGVDGVFTQTVTNVSLGIDVTLIGVVDQAQDGIIIEENRENNQLYSIECLEPGIHDVTFTSEIEPLSASVIDLVDNNSKEFTLTVDCAIPVTLNIKPHSDPNSINTKSKGNIPTAVLTTDVGEYGNPIAVDATTILPLTTHFGAKNLSINDNGATEKHNKGHVEDSFELDEVTRDGDDDMVLHFPTQDTDLAPGDTEACIKGKLADNGNEFTFFGCDFVNIVK